MKMTKTSSIDMSRSPDIAPQPPSLRQRALLQQQSEQLRAEAQRPIQISGLGARDEDVETRELRLRNARELASIQAEIAALLEDKVRLEAAVAAASARASDLTSVAKLPPPPPRPAPLVIDDDDCESSANIANFVTDADDSCESDTQRVRRLEVVMSALQQEHTRKYVLHRFPTYARIRGS